ncbi:MAG: hypothetical protein AAF335_04265 [Bacteroidota bacterium]
MNNIIYRKSHLSSVTNMNGLFYFASSFNQGLCAWGQKATPQTKVYDMFVSSACPTTSSPDFTNDPPGPFCLDCRMSNIKIVKDGGTKNCKPKPVSIGKSESDSSL